MEFLNYIDGLRTVKTNIVENEKLKFKEMTYVKSEYARLVNLSIFVCLPFNIYVYAY